MSQIVLQHATLWDGTGAAALTEAVVVVEDGRIARVGQDTGDLSGAELYDLGGAFLLPGLIDCHVHLTGDGEPDLYRALRKAIPYVTLEAAAHALKTLEAGFTTVRDAGAGYGIDVSLRDAVAAGIVPGPRLQVSGVPLSITGGHGDDFLPPHVHIEGRRVVDGPDEARKAARTELRAGVDWIKLCATGGVLSERTSPHARGLTVEEMRAAVEEAHNAGRKTLAHAQGTQGIKNAILAGVDSIEHGFYLDDEAIQLMLDRGVYLVPTLAAVHHIVANAARMGASEWGLTKACEAREAHLESFRRALEANVPIAMGTDAATPFNHHGCNARELELMVEAGMSPQQALLSATVRAADLLGLSEHLGTVTPGKIADLIVVAGDPLADIRVLQDVSRILLVMKEGQVVVDRGLEHRGRG